MALAVARFGALDILVNNAGRTLNKPLLDTSAADWDNFMAVNARGAFLFSREIGSGQRDCARQPSHTTGHAGSAASGG